MRLNIVNAILLSALILTVLHSSSAQELDKALFQDSPIDSIDIHAKDRQAAKCIVIAEVKAIADIDITADEFKFVRNKTWDQLLKEPETCDGIKAKRATLSIVECIRGNLRRRDEIEVYYVDYTLANIIKKAPLPLVLQAKEPKIERVLLHLNPVSDKNFIPATGTYQSAPSCDYLYDRPMYDR